MLRERSSIHSIISRCRFSRNQCRLKRLRLRCVAMAATTVILMLHLSHLYLSHSHSHSNLRLQEQVKVRGHHFVRLTSMVVNAETVAATTTAGQQQQAQEDYSHFVDTKYWIRNTEFGERDNWRNRRKPCTLLERIKINEQSVVSMGDSMDILIGALESNIKELLLPINGMLLLEESTLFGGSAANDGVTDGIDSTFIEYLNESGDCVDSSSNITKQQQQQQVSNEQQPDWFYFEPQSDQMSWFNPANWKSGLYSEGEDGVDDWGHLIPESHGIPCTEDIVVFGDRHSMLGPTIEANERSNVISFKVNFKPSESIDKKQQFENVRVDNIRVAKLKIGNQTYNQQEFDKLVNSNKYNNILFEFNNTMNVIKLEEEDSYPSVPLIIDESSNHFDLCMDEAGCWCGNENSNIMKTICSFYEPLDDLDQPCYDPIASVGYCNKICATVITIIMDPTIFSHKFVSSVIDKVREDDESLTGVFKAMRRTYDNKYEITFRHMPKNNAISYETTLDNVRKYGQLVYRHLSNDGTRTFYGIRSINIESSVNWKLRNRESLLWTSFLVFSLISLSILTYQERANNHNIEVSRVDQAFGWFIYAFRRMRVDGGSALDETESFVRYGEPTSLAQDGSNTIYSSAANIPLVELDSQ